MLGPIENEIETKLDVPLNEKSDVILGKLEGILKQEGWEIMLSRNDEKELLYYDTPDFSLYFEGSTLRRVTPFDPSKFKGSVRYDFKQGNGEKRTEIKYWSNRILNPSEIVDALQISKDYPKISSVAMVLITPEFREIRKNGTDIELKLDTCWIDGEDKFRELELELKHGNPLDVKNLSDKIAQSLGLNYLHQQKYGRVVEVMGLLRGRSYEDES